MRQSVYFDFGNTLSVGSILTILLTAFVTLLQAQSEQQFIQHLNTTHFHGLTEVAFHGGRADIVTDEYAIEVEWANKWKNSIGQALWYGLQKNKKPGIVVLMKDINDRKYAIMLQSAIDYAGLTDKIKVWLYPDDFEKNSMSIENPLSSSTQNKATTSLSYTKNKGSKKRHNSRCRDFDCENCLPCEPDEGIACKNCGG